VVRNSAPTLRRSIRGAALRNRERAGGSTPAPGASSEFDAEKQLEHLRAGLRSVLPGEYREQRTTRVLAGHRRSILRVVPVGVSPGFGFAEGAVVPGIRGSRLIFCTSQTTGKAQAQRCRRALEYLATKGTPDEVDLSPKWAGEAAILDHRLIVPEGCRLEEVDEHGGRLQCETGMLAWTVMDNRLMPSTSRWLDENVAMLRRLGGGGWSEEQVPCRVEEVDTRCARLQRRSDSGSALQAVAGTATKNSKALLVICVFQGDRTTRAPRLCNETLWLP
jgi:hypothetical protein